HLAIGPAALALVLVQDEVVEAGCEQRRLAPDVLVTAVAGAADHDAAPAGFHRAHGLPQGAHGIDVVRGVRDDRRTVPAAAVEAPGRVVAVVVEPLQGPLREPPVHAERPGCAHGRQRVLHLEADTAAPGDRDRAHVDLAAPVAEAAHDPGALDVQRPPAPRA